MAPPYMYSGETLALLKTNNVKAIRAPFVSNTPYGFVGKGQVMRPEGAREDQKSSSIEAGLGFRVAG